jgi:hypothetical protein
MVRTQIDLHRQQAITLKQPSKNLGLSEAESMRQAGYAPRPSFPTWMLGKKRMRSCWRYKRSGPYLRRLTVGDGMTFTKIIELLITTEWW